MKSGPRRIGTPRKHRSRLSLCMIVKNEAETLEKCLEFARPHVDEIVVVDTGSTDGTIEIARRYADVFDEIEWPGSFSIARNHSFDLATGEYILVLDGDEFIENSAHWNRIRKALRQPDLAAIQFPVRNLLREENLVAADRMWQERVIRNDKRLRYRGKVHNQIQESIAEFMVATGRKQIRVEAEVIHTGYALSQERMAEKYAPRVELLIAEYVQPQSETYRAYYGYQLATAYYVLQRFEDALDVFSEIEFALLSPQNAFYSHLLVAQSALRLSRSTVALVHCNDMLTLDRDEPVGYFAAGLALMAAGQVSDGMLMLLEAYKVNDRAGINVRFLLNPVQVLRLLGRISGQAGLTKHGQLFTSLADKGLKDTDIARSLIASLQSDIILSEPRAA